MQVDQAADGVVVIPKDIAAETDKWKKVVEAAKGRPHVHAYVYPKADHAFARVGGTHWQARAATIANGRSAEALAAALS